MLMPDHTCSLFKKRTKGANPQRYYILASYYNHLSDHNYLVIPNQISIQLEQ